MTKFITISLFLLQLYSTYSYSQLSLEYSNVKLDCRSIDNKTKRIWIYVTISVINTGDSSLAITHHDNESDCNFTTDSLTSIFDHFRKGGHFRVFNTKLNPYGKFTREYAINTTIDNLFKGYLDISYTPILGNHSDFKKTKKEVVKSRQVFINRKLLRIFVSPIMLINNCAI